MRRKINKKRRTPIHPHDILKRRAEQHEHDAHAEDLHAAAGHVEHEGLHGQRLGGRDRELPRAFLFEGGVGGGVGGRGRVGACKGA